MARKGFRLITNYYLWLYGLIKQASMIRDLRSVVDISKNEVISSQRDQIKMKDELLHCKNKQLKSIQAEIKTTVHDSVELEIRSLRTVIQSSPASVPVDCTNVQQISRMQYLMPL